MKTIVLLYGGRSGEHEVSLVSAASILSHLDLSAYRPILVGITKKGKWVLQEEVPIPPETGSMSGLPLAEKGRKVYVLPGAGFAVESPSGSVESLPCDLVFPVLHGTFGEDGTIQGLLECAGIPYVGAGVLGSAIGMDKQVTKELLKGAGIPVVDSILIHAADWANPGFFPSLARKIEARFGWPCFVKPACSGSSVGTSKVSDSQTLESALFKAFLYDEKVLVEEFVFAREIECAVLGNDKPKAFAPGEVIPSHEFYDYDAKYSDPKGASFKVPAPLLAEQNEAVLACAIKAYKTLCLSGMARVDFFLDKKTGDIAVNEVNTIPGFTSISMYPMLCKDGGLPYPELIDSLIDLAFERFERRSELRFSYDS
ncbi:MAG: D-alanine--D-alanine ligase [Spirochaetes bacterium]|nr:D-alanine--D-alanine ligase [Spirochaetota bacterium]